MNKQGLVTAEKNRKDISLNQIKGNTDTFFLKLLGHILRIQLLGLNGSLQVNYT